MTSHDIARASGVTQPTVSRALRGDPRVAPATASAIRKAAEQLGYSPHVAARSLITQRAGAVAIVISDLRNPFYPQLAQSLQSELERLHYRSLLLNELTGHSAERIQTMMRSGAIDGAIVATATIDEKTADLLTDSPAPIVLVVRDVPGIEHDAVVADNRGGSRLAADLLVAEGHRRIGMIVGPEDTSTGAERAAGFVSGIAAHGCEIAAPMNLRSAYSYEGGNAAGRALLGLEHPPTALFCGNDVIAIGALDAARELSVPVPERLSIVGFDDIDLAAWTSFALTTVHQPLDEMARQAAELLGLRIEGDDRPARRIEVPTHLVRRQTHGPALISSP